MTNYERRGGVSEGHPALPKGTGFILVAAPAYDPDWGLFQCDQEVPAGGPVDILPDVVEELLRSAEGYPPTLAIARDEVAARFDGEVVTRQAFLEYHVGRVKAHLESRPTAKYILAQAVVDEPGYLEAGCYYWVLGPCP